MEVRLETPRLILRMWRESDLSDYAEMCAHPEVMNHLTGKPMNRMEAWRHMAFLIGHWHLRGYGHWVVEEKGTGAFVGRIGFLNPPDYPGFELGWALARKHWGKGYATEGAARALDYGFDELHQAHVISLIDRENTRSISVALRLGASYEDEVVVMDHRVDVYGIHQSDLRPASP